MDRIVNAQNSNNSTPSGPSSPNPKEQEKVYHLTIPFHELHLGKFLGLSTSVYMGESIVYYPFDLLRTKLQVQRDSNFTIGRSISLARSLGWRGLYVGFWPYTVGSLPSHAVYFLSYNIIRDKLQEVDDRWNSGASVKGRQAMWVSFVSGALADVAANVFVTPLEVVVQRLQIQDKASSTNYKGSLDAIRVIYNNEGYRGFYRGFGATLITYAPASAIWWTAYERCKLFCADHLLPGSHQMNQSNQIIIGQSKIAQVVAGGVAGIITAVMTNPMDVIKTRLQTQHHQQNLQKGVVKTLYSNSWMAMKSMLKEEGLKSFGRGIGPRLVTSAFFSSWFGFIYEWVLESSRK